MVLNILKYPLLFGVMGFKKYVLLYIYYVVFKGVRK